MDIQDSMIKPQTEHSIRDGLIKRECEVIDGLEKMFKDPELTTTEKTSVATALETVSKLEVIICKIFNPDVLKQGSFANKYVFHTR